MFKDTQIVPIPHLITVCENTFDKNVLPIKKPIKDIGDLNNLAVNETKNVFLYDDSNFISNTFFTELNKKKQCYGYISLLYNNSDKHLVNSKNRLKFNVIINNQREFLTFQLEDILTPHKIKTRDSKIHNFSILATEKMNNFKIIDEIKIEGFQKFEQYKKINRVNIEINDTEIQTKLRFYSKWYKFRFILNSLLFSSNITEETSAIHIVTNGLNDAKNVLINDKIFHAIGIIYISEIENWEKIKNTSHWTNVIFTDSKYLIAAKHFVFAFETRDLYNLLNFEYSLLDSKGKLLKFADGEDEIPAINFSIQIVY